MFLSFQQKKVKLNWVIKNEIKLIRMKYFDGKVFYTLLLLWSFSKLFILIWIFLVYQKQKKSSWINLCKLNAVNLANFRPPFPCSGCKLYTCCVIQISFLKAIILLKTKVKQKNSKKGNLSKQLRYRSIWILTVPLYCVQNKKRIFDWNYR